MSEPTSSPTQTPLEQLGTSIGDYSPTFGPDSLIRLVREFLPVQSTDQSQVDPKAELKGADQLESTSDTASRQEEAGCALWDLVASEDHATFLVNNMLLQVVPATLQTALVAHQSRIAEISLGILANLACHKDLATHIACKEDLVSTVVDDALLASSDSAILTEACRLLTVTVQTKSCGEAWLVAASRQEVLTRLLFIANNTLRSQLLERSIDVLVAVVCAQPRAGQLLMDNGVLQMMLAVLQGYKAAVQDLQDSGEQEDGTGVRPTEGAVDGVLRLIEGMCCHDASRLLLLQSSDLIQAVVDVLRVTEEEGIAGGAVLAADYLQESSVPLLCCNTENLEALLQFHSAIPGMEDDTVENAYWSLLSHVGRHLQRSGGITMDTVRLLLDPLNRMVNDAANPHLQAQKDAFSELCQPLQQWLNDTTNQKQAPPRTNEKTQAEGADFEPVLQHHSGTASLGQPRLDGKAALQGRVRELLSRLRPGVWQ